MERNKITFWGVRGSFPTPEKDKMDFGGHTSCISIYTKHNELVVFDMGTGMKQLGEALVADISSPKEIHILMSHYHWDHIIGFLSFAPAFCNDYTIHIHGKRDKKSLKEIFDHMLNPIFWPVPMEEIKSELIFHEIEDSNFSLTQNLNVSSQVHGHPNGALSFRLHVDGLSLTYITDCEHGEDECNPNLIELAKETDILIHDAHFLPDELERFKGWGHSSWEQAVEVARSAHVKQLILFHHNPSYKDAIVKSIENAAQKKFQNTISAKQGMSIYL